MITIVSPWYGPDTVGGAETQARSLARALHALGIPVQVWASTGRDAFHPDDTAHYAAGESFVDGIPVWRFRPGAPDQQGIPLFFRCHPAYLPPLASFAPHELQLLGTLLSSDELYAAIHAAPATTRFIFIPYPFPTSFWGARLAPERSWLLPCLHDEPYAYYATYRHLFQTVRGILANSYAEAELVQRLYQLPAERVHVPGEGIDLTPRGDGEIFRRTYHLDGPDAPVLLLYVGRRDESKNIALLLAYVREYWARRGLTMRLLLAGQGPLELPTGAESLVIDLGYLPEQDKHHAYAAAQVFVHPSIYESFSIVLMEAWLQGTPALVNGACAVTADHCRRSGGGLIFGDFGTFAAALDLLLCNPDLRTTIGERGRAYVLRTCNWEDVARRTATAVLGET